MKTEEYARMLTVEGEINRLGAEISALISRREPLQRELQKLQSQQYIRVNNISKSDVENPDGKDRPHFWSVWDFAAWLKCNESKPWAVWNGRIYRSSDLIAGRMPESPAFEDDLS
jgi:hypothetical protein